MKSKIIVIWLICVGILLGAFGFFVSQSMRAVEYKFSDDGSYAIAYQCNKKEKNVIVRNQYKGKPVTAIAESTFYDCDALTNATVGKKVTSIGAVAFYDCDALRKVTIFADVTSIGAAAFYDCVKLTIINFKGTMAAWNAIDKGNSWNFGVPATQVVCSDGKVAL